MLLLVEFIICIIVAGIGYLIIISRRKYSELKKTGIGFLKPIPIFGNIFNVITGREHIAELLKKATDTYPNDKWVKFKYILKITIN